MKMKYQYELKLKKDREKLDLRDCAMMIEKAIREVLGDKVTRVVVHKDFYEYCTTEELGRGKFVQIGRTISKYTFKIFYDYGYWYIPKDKNIKYYIFVWSKDKKKKPIHQVFRRKKVKSCKK